MLSSKIDLTEHRDFAGWDNMLAEDLPIGEIFRGETSLEEHEKYIESVKKFGRKYHTDISPNIFGFKSLKGINETCVKCGGRILPWKRNIYSNSQMCDECRKDFKGGIPWRKPILANLENPRPEATNLFGLR